MITLLLILTNLKGKKINVVVAQSFFFYLAEYNNALLDVCSRKPLMHCAHKEHIQQLRLSSAGASASTG